MGDVHRLEPAWPVGYQRHPRGGAVRDVPGGQIVVFGTFDLWTACYYPTVPTGGFIAKHRHPDAAEACAAAERAYCGAYVGKALPRDCVMCTSASCMKRDQQHLCPCPELQS